MIRTNITAYTIDAANPEAEAVNIVGNHPSSSDSCPVTDQFGGGGMDQQLFFGKSAQACNPADRWLFDGQGARFPKGRKQYRRPRGLSLRAALMSGHL